MATTHTPRQARRSISLGLRESWEAHHAPRDDRVGYGIGVDFDLGLHRE